MSSRATLFALSEKLLQACEAGSLATVRSLVPQLYPAPGSLTSPDVVPMSLAMAKAAQHGQPSVLQYLFSSLPPNPNRQFPWDLPLTVPEESLPEEWKSARYSDLVVLNAVHSGNSSVVQTLLDVGMPVDYEIEQAGAPLGLAVSNQSQDLTNFLLQKGANANALTGVGRYPLIMVAATKPSVDIVTALLDRGANLSGSGALVAAAETGNIPTAEVLLKKGSDINETRKHGLWQDKQDTPLHAAVRAGQTQMVKFLVDRGTRQDLRNEALSTARDIAKEGNQTEILNILDEID